MAKSWAIDRASDWDAILACTGDQSEDGQSSSIHGHTCQAKTEQHKQVNVM